VKKDAFLGRAATKTTAGKALMGGIDRGIEKLLGVGERAGAATAKGVSGYFGNSANAAAGAAPTLGSRAVGGLRSAAGVQAGQAAFEKPMHYVTRPLRATLLPNLGKPLNAVRAGLLGTYVGHQGYQGYQALGEGADKVKQLADAAWNAGASQTAVSDLNRYSTRGGILQGWLRGRGWNMGPLTGESTTAQQQFMDRMISSTADDALASHMSKAMSGEVKGFEVLNPLGSLVRRGVETGIGEEAKKETGGWTEGLADGLKQVAGMPPAP
jgi:hypothetical protein